MPASTPTSTTASTSTAPKPSTIPRFPLSHFNSSPPSTRNPLIQRLRHALLSTGFLYLTDVDHHLPPQLTARLIAILPRIFQDLSAEQKSTAALVNTPHFLGYSSFGAETTGGARDEREQYEFAGSRSSEGEGDGEIGAVAGTADGELGNVSAKDAGNGRRLYLRLRGPNQYPDFEGREELEHLVREYIAAVQKIAEEFLGLVNVALGLEDGTLEEFARDAQDRLKLVHYWTGGDAIGLKYGNDCGGVGGGGVGRRQQVANGHGRGEVEEFVQGVGPHKDSSGWLTFLLQASPGTRGLQALSKDGEWLDVPPVEGSLVVNMGQAFEAATNGVCKATTHRVLLPKGMGSRYSVPFFMGVRPSLSKAELQGLWKHFDPLTWQTRESEEGMLVDSPFLRGEFETWGEAQLRTKIRSHRDVGEKWYGDVFEKYVNGG